MNFGRREAGATASIAAYIDIDRFAGRAVGKGTGLYRGRPIAASPRFVMLYGASEAV